MPCLVSAGNDDVRGEPIVNSVETEQQVRTVAQSERATPADRAVDVAWKPEPLVLTVEQVAALLQVSRDTIENLHRTRQLPAVRIGKHNRWRLQDVRGFVDRLKEQSTG